MTGTTGYGSLVTPHGDRISIAFWIKHGGPNWVVRTHLTGEQFLQVMQSGSTGFRIQMGDTETPCTWQSDGPVNPMHGGWILILKAGETEEV